MMAETGPNVGSTGQGNRDRLDCSQDLSPQSLA